MRRQPAQAPRHEPIPRAPGLRILIVALVTALPAIAAWW